MTNERSSMIDWDTAVSVGARLAGEGPSVSRVEADDVVAELRAGAERSSPLVRGFTGLVAEERTAPVLVVDRRGWLQANVDGFAEIVSPLIDRLQAKYSRGEIGSGRDIRCLETSISDVNDVDGHGNVPPNSSRLEVEPQLHSEAGESANCRGRRPTGDGSDPVE